MVGTYIILSNFSIDLVPTCKVLKITHSPNFSQVKQKLYMYQLSPEITWHKLHMENVHTHTHHSRKTIISYRTKVFSKHHKKINEKKKKN